MTNATLGTLLDEYSRALAYTSDLTSDLTADQVAWRPGPDSSAIGWHLGHQGAVAHYMVRNLTSAERTLDAELDQLMDSATPEPDRELPALDRILEYRSAVAERLRHTIGKIDSGNVGAPAQLRLIAGTLMIAVINHEYQHSKWIGEVRIDQHGKQLPPEPTSELLTIVDGYVMCRPGS